jgi:acylphosphatase
MAKARVLVEGIVQGVGYRALVKHIATLFGVKGLVRNLEEGGVEIYCDGDKNSIERLLKAIEVKGNPEDQFNLNVRKVESYWEGEKGYSPAWKEYNRFEIDYGEDRSYSPYEQESLESFEMAKLSFSRLQGEVAQLRSDTNENFTKLGGNVELLRSDTNENFTKLGGNVELLRSDTNENFQIMEKKYGNISKELVATKKELKSSTSDLKCSVDELKNSIDSLPEKMTNALIKGIKKLK